MTDRILILAAGQSTRMRGRDKLLEPVANLPLLRRQVIMALGLGWPVHVALPPTPGARADVIEGLNITCHTIKDSTEGMGGSLRGAVADLPEDTSDLMLLLGDLPEIETQDLHRLVSARDANPETAIWRGATAQGAPGHPILFSQETLPMFATLSGDDGGRAVIKAFGDRIQMVPLPGDRARRDLDTPEEWARWHAEQAQQ